MRRRATPAGIDWRTPLNKFLCTEYLYHNTCATEGCDFVRHELPGVCSDDPCPKCGGGCWRMGMGSRAAVSAPWYVQYLSADCPTCRKTQARLKALTAQMGLLEEARQP